MEDSITIAPFAPVYSEENIQASYFRAWFNADS